MKPRAKEKQSVRAIVSLGSNVEPRANYLERACAALAAMPGTHVERMSTVIETAPVDVPPEFAELKFLNQVIVLRTTLEVRDFSARMHAVEDEMGRVRTVRNGPRTLDVDLIDFDGIVCDDPELTLPHPRAHLRDFVMHPLGELGFGMRQSENGRRHCIYAIAMPDMHASGIGGNVPPASTICAAERTSAHV